MSTDESFEDWERRQEKEEQTCDSRRHSMSFTGKLNTGSFAARSGISLEDETAKEEREGPFICSECGKRSWFISDCMCSFCLKNLT